MKILSVVQNNAWVPHLYVKALGSTCSSSELIKFLKEANVKINEEFDLSLSDEDIKDIVIRLLRSKSAWVLDEAICIEILDV